MAAFSPTRATALLLALGLPLLAAALAARPAVAGTFDDEDLGDDDFGPASSKPAPKKGKGAKSDDEPTGPMGDDEDPEWDAPREARPSGGGGGGDGFDDDPDFDDPSFDDPELAPERPKPAPPKAAPAPSGPARLKLDTSGKAPLADNFPATVVAKDVDAVVVEQTGHVRKPFEGLPPAALARQVLLVSPFTLANFEAQCLRRLIELTCPQP